MRVRIKLLKGDQFHIDDVEVTNTVAEVKKIIETQQGPDFPAEALKLILLGKVIKDDKTLESYSFNPEENYLVLVVGKKKKKKPAKPVVKEEVKPTPTENKEPTQTPAPAVQNPTPAPVNLAPAHQGPVITNESIQNVVAMGFAEGDAKAALEAAFGDVNVAIEFLMNPELMERAIQHRRAQAAVPAPGAAAAVAGGNPLQAFRNSPEFPRVRNILATNPGAMEQILQALQISNPPLFEYLTASTENMGAFVEMLNAEGDNVPAQQPAGTPVGGDANPFGEAAAPAGNAGGGLGGLGGLGGMGGGGGGAPNVQQIAQLLQIMQSLPPEQREAVLRRFGLTPETFGQLMQGIIGQGGLGGVGGLGGAGAGAGAPRQPRARINLSADEQAAIGRLQALGFPRRACIEAYLACDKNETLAANFLFDNPQELEEAQGPPPPPAANNGNNNTEGDI